VSKKIKKLIKPKKLKKITKKIKPWKKNILKFLKNQPVWFGFGFISLKPKKLN
jgi:hypothetical protein